MNNIDVDENSKLRTNQNQAGTTDLDTGITKREMVRQKMAIALMAVGGLLLAALIWFALENRN